LPVVVVVVWNHLTLKFGSGLLKQQQQQQANNNNTASRISNSIVTLGFDGMRHLASVTHLKQANYKTSTLDWKGNSEMPSLSR